MDTVEPTVEVLPEVVSALAGRMPVLVDGGNRRGTDIFKAIALGASFVLIGRPQVHGLAIGGATGVAHICALLRNKLDDTMALAGAASLADIRPQMLAPKAGFPFREA